ncbi:hypothetical protein [Amycolatopsis panacis]|uniref:Uncharacterized protein n=1 Tax=Amycolatopsis panacis TaxID=2340917 RepID=A0A419HJQ5_9PSEU|nr:hypothetical protein [Amycolatopsis panacis]RJQ76075.1 hypothetical protein D5S19_30870 [Amycolatopsis panacis]
MEEARFAPHEGNELMIKMMDSRSPDAEGWVKMKMEVNGVKIHYLRNRISGAVDDFEFKDG